MGNLACKLITLCCQTACDYKNGEAAKVGLRLYQLPYYFFFKRKQLMLMR